MKTLEELKKLDSKKLSEELETIHKEYFKISFEVSNGQSKNSHMVRNYRKQIARIKTLLNQNKATNQKS